MKADKYIPTEEDVIWAENLIRLVRHGGTWGCSWGVYSIDHEDKKVRLIIPNPQFPEELFEDMQHKTEQTFKAIGYEVI